MSRYRPPRRRGSAYITPEGEQRLRAELHQLWKVERPQVTSAVHEAAKNGDRSENGDYIYGKRRLREIDSRVRFLNKRLEELKVIDRPPDNTDKIYFGAWVRTFDPPVEGRLSGDLPDLDVGQVVRVRLVSTSVERGFIDFELAH